ncbi:MAG: very short patch repair endonuclease [Ferruginibacter sp.]
MADTFTKEQRSQIMRQVKSSRNKSTELTLIQFFKDNSIKGWRRNYSLFGRPDFVFPLTKEAVFVDGCFWHGHNCRNTKPKDNKDYWEQKISRNKKRDRTVTKTLTSNGWTVIRIWECQLKNEKTLKNKLTNKSA